MGREPTKIKNIQVQTFLIANSYTHSIPYLYPNKGTLNVQLKRKKICGKIHKSIINSELKNNSIDTIEPMIIICDVLRTCFQFLKRTEMTVTKYASLIITNSR